MPYRIKARDKSVARAVRRIADGQIAAAIASLDARELPDAVHDVRKRCKKLRGLVRLVQPVFADYALENAAFRDAAALISTARDSKVMQDTYDLLVREYQDQVDRRALGSIRRRFTLQRKAEELDDQSAQRLADLRRCLEEARARASGWSLSGDGWDAMSGGVTKTYARARKAAAHARSSPDGETFHELRKHVKYHWYHCRLLEGLWPDMMAMRKKAASRLADILGEHHDLDVFAGKLAAHPQAYADERGIEVATGLARARQQRLEETAWPMLDRLLAQSPGALDDHLEALWHLWRKGG